MRRDVAEQRRVESNKFLPWPRAFQLELDYCYAQEPMTLNKLSRFGWKRRESKAAG